MEPANPASAPSDEHRPADRYGDALKQAAKALSTAFDTQTVAQRDRSVYIAGPMTGIPNFNRHAFEAARAFVAQYGRSNDGAAGGAPRWTEVYTPFDNGVPILGDPDPGYPVATYLRADIDRILLRVGSVILLPGWPRSRGTALELAIASALQLEIYFLAPDARGLVAMG